MVKSKNHTNHNQNAKNHKNGIKRIARQRFSSQKGINQMLRKNTRRARKFDPTIKKEVNLTKKIESMRANKEVLMAVVKARIVRIAQKKQALKDKAKNKGKKKRSKKSKKK